MHRLALLSLLLASATAGAEACGWISDFDVAPRSRGLYEAHIVEIDGQPPGTSVQRNFRVSAGRHQVRVAERIDGLELPLSAQLRIGQHHLIEIEVEPDKRYFIAAQYNHAQRLDRHGGYWQPALWQVRDKICR